MRPPVTFGPSLRPDPTSATPLVQQLAERLRVAMLSGVIGPGMRLPATRTLAHELGVSRTTVVGAFEQLIAEGYLVARTGAGTFVASVLPERALHASPLPAAHRGAGALRALSQRGQMLARTPAHTSPDDGPPLPFRPGMPDTSLVPFEIWNRIAARLLRHTGGELLGYGHPCGFLPLREAIAEHVRTARAVHCEAAQILITAGSQHALELASRMLIDPGDTVWIEDPGYAGARGALLAAGGRLVGVPVDDEGMAVEAGRHLAPQARLAVVTPSHQYPLGVTMSLRRRLALLEWAAQAGAWVLEDDYDSEYGYSGHPLPALQGIDTSGRVIYIGTFSKTLFPALRIGYMVVPPDLVDAFAAARALTDRHPATLPQATLAAFISDGHYARHLRRMRTIYAERQAALCEAATHHLGGWLHLAPARSGIHLSGTFPTPTDDTAVSRVLAAHQITAPPLSAYCYQQPARAGLVLGYAAFAPPAIHTAIRRIAALSGMLHWQ